MNLLYVTGLLDVSGVSKLNFDILKRLKRDYSIHIMTTEKERTGDSWCGLYSSVFAPSFSLFNYPKKERFKVFIEYLNNNSIDVIFTTHSLWLYENCARIKASYPSVKVVDSLHVLEPFFLRGGFPDISANRLVHRNLDATILISEDLRGYLSRNYKVDANRLFVVRNGVDRNVFKNRINLNNDWRLLAGFPTQGKIVGFIGRMTIQKRPFLFIEVAKRMLEKEPSLNFYMIGNGPLFDKVERTVACDRIRERIRIWRQHDDIPSVLNSTDLLLVTSSYEGAPLTIIEALASGAQVISSEVGAIREYTTDHCTLVKVGKGEVKEFVEAAFAVLSKSEKRVLNDIAIDISETVAGYKRVFEHVTCNYRLMRFI